MAVTIEMQNTGNPRARREILASVEHVLSDAEGEWRVSIVGSRADDKWEMKVEGPRGFERSYTLVGAAGEHHPEAVRNVLIKLLPPHAMIDHVCVAPHQHRHRGRSWDGFFEARGTNDEEDSEFESSSQRAKFASSEQD
jgi:hypothetical protein